MTWPWPRRIKAQIAEAEKAAEVARQELAETRARRPEVDREVEKLRRHREANHLTQMFETLISGRG